MRRRRAARRGVAVVLPVSVALVAAVLVAAVLVAAVAGPAAALTASRPGARTLKSGAATVKLGVGTVKLGAATFKPRIGTAMGIEPRHGSDVAVTGPAIPAAYHGGSVMRDVTIHTVFWAPAGYRFDGPPSPGVLGYQALIQQFFTDVAHDSGTTANVFSLLDQYGDRSGRRQLPDPLRRGRRLRRRRRPVSARFSPVHLARRRGHLRDRSRAPAGGRQAHRPG